MGLDQMYCKLCMKCLFIYNKLSRGLIRGRTLNNSFRNKVNIKKNIKSKKVIKKNKKRSMMGQNNKKT